MGEIVIILPNYNTEDTIRGCIESLLHTAEGCPFDLVAVDDGSTDNSPDILKEYSFIQVIRIKRSGIDTALNRARQETEPLDIVRIDGDAKFISSNWLGRLEKYAEALSEVGVIGTQIVFDNYTYHAAWRNVIHPKGLHHALGGQKIQNLIDYPQPIEVDACLGVCTFYKREALEAIGGFDENYNPCWIGDDDSCLMAWREGFRVYIHPEIKTIHLSNKRKPRAFQKGKVEIVKHHQEYWFSKWGWYYDAPDLEQIRKRWEGTTLWKNLIHKRYSLWQI